MSADRAQANQGVGKVPKPIPASLSDTLARKLRKALKRMASRQNRVRDQASHSFIHALMAQSPKQVRVGRGKKKKKKKK